MTHRTNQHPRASDGAPRRGARRAAARRLLDGPYRRVLAMPAGGGRLVRQRCRRRSGGAGPDGDGSDGARGAALACAERRPGRAAPRYGGSVRVGLRRRVRSLRLARAAVRWRRPRLVGRGGRRRDRRSRDALAAGAGPASETPRGPEPRPGRRRRRRNRRPESRSRQPPPFRPPDRVRGRLPVRRKSTRSPAVCVPAKSSRGSGSRPSSTRTASTARRATCGSCWSPPAGGSRNGIGRAVAAAGAVRGSGGAGSLDAARDAGRAPRPAALARLRRIERALRQMRARWASSSSCRRSPASTPRPWALAGTLADAAPERCTIQVIHWASPRFGAASRAWAEPRSEAGGALARMGSGRRDLLGPGGWRRLHGGGPPFTLSDYRVFVTACLAGGSRPGRGDCARRVPPGARRHAGVRRGADPPAGAGRAAVIGRRACRARHCRGA